MLYSSSGILHSASGPAAVADEREYRRSFFPTSDKTACTSASAARLHVGDWKQTSD